MKIDVNSLKAFSTELPTECAEFIINLRKRDSIPDFIANLDRLTEWYSTLGKIEMGRWVHVLNDCDEVLEMATRDSENSGMIIDQDDHMDRAVISILRFTSLLFENSFSRSVYSSMDHLLKLLDSRKMFVVVQTLRLLLVISKSSRYITQHVQHNEKKLLYMKLTANTECWSGKLRTMKMSDCCVEHLEGVDVFNLNFRTPSGAKNFHVDVAVPFSKSVADLKTIMDDPASQVEEAEKILTLTKLRLAYNFDNASARFHCVMARLISISVLFYSRCLLDEWRINCLVNDDSIEQICALLQLDVSNYNLLLDAVKTEAMKTLASIVFLEKPRKIQLVVDCLGLNSYHGFTSSLIRTCVDKLKAGAIEPNAEYSVAFVTALFSLVYHIAGFDYGGDSLISCSMVSSLLTVVKATNLPDSQISFVTRAVRIIDILTGIEVAEFNVNDGMNIIVDRFVHEVNICKKHKETTSNKNQLIMCHQQRTALMKSLLNFLKRSIADMNYAAQVRRIMETELPRAIVYIIENPEYFGSSLLHCAIHLTTSFIYQEPAQLTFLQDNGLTEAMLKSLFDEKFIVSRDIVTGLPNICSALCLNERGLKCFNELKPLERIFRIIFSTKFITSLRKRKTEILEASTSLGTAFDELMRHQPTLRKDLLSAFVKVLDDILAFGSLDSSKCAIAWSIGKMNSPDDEITRRETRFGQTDPPDQGSSSAPPSSVLPSNSEDSLDQNEKKIPNNQQSVFQICHEQDGVLVLPLGDYLGMIGALLEAILTNRAAHENSSVMLECNIPQRLVKLLTLERPYPALFQSTYLTNLANIIRHLLTQSSKIDAFDVLATNICEQLQKYERCTKLADMTKSRMFLLNRINCLAFVACNFLKTSLSNVHDTRALLLNYFGSSETGQTLIRLIFEAFRKLNCDCIYINTRQTMELAALDELNASTPPTTTTAVNISPASVVPPIVIAEESTAINALPNTTTVTQASVPVITKMPLKRLDQGSYERLIHATATRLHKQLAEIITHLGKIFCSTVSRPRRGFDSTLFKHAYSVCEMIFKGIVHTLEYEDLLFKSNNWSIYVCHILTVLKKLIFDDYQGHYVMLPFFFKSGCHNAFFALGEYLVTAMFKEISAVGIASWLSIVQRLVCVSNVLVTKNRQELLRFKVEGFDTKKYLAVCHQDALTTLQKFFKCAVAHKPDNNERDMLDKIIGSIQVLVKGIVQLYEIDKKDCNQPELEILIHEIDTDKVKQLVEMGFSQSDAVDALLQHTSVPEAAEYLIAMDSNSRNASTVLRATASSNISVITSVPAINVLASAEPVSASAPEPEPVPVFSAEDNSQRNEVEAAEVAEQMDTDQPAPQLETAPCASGTELLEKIETTNQIITFEDLKNIKTSGFKELIKYICDNIVPDCIALIECDSNLVFCVSELLSVFMNDSAASDWFKNVFVCKLIADHEQLVTVLSNEDPTIFDELATKFASILHLFCLLWQVLENVKMYTLLGDDFITNITNILFTFVEERKNLTSRLIPPILLCIDMYEKEKRIDIRQQMFANSVEHVQWYYWVTDRYGSNNEWRDYTPVCSATLNKAFREGKSSTTLVVNDKNVIVDFIQMTQRQAEVANNTSTNPHSTPIYAKAKLKDDFDIKMLFETEHRLNMPADLDRCHRMITCLMKLLQPPEDNTHLSVELAYSILSLLLRLVTMKDMSKTFKIDDIRTLVRLECNGRTPLMSTIVTLILRTFIDNEETLENAFTSIIQSAENGTPACLADLNSRIWFTKSKKQQKEWRRAMRFLFPLAVRDPSIFTTAMKKSTVLKNGEIALTNTKPETTLKPLCGEHNAEVLKQILTVVVTELLTTEFPIHSPRVLRASNLLKIISEFLRNYPYTASFFVEMRHDNKTIVAWIIDRFMLNVDHVPDIFASAQSVLVNLVVGPAATRASEIIVNEIKTLLAIGVTSLGEWEKADKFNYRRLSLQMIMLCKLIELLRESAQANSTNKVRDMKQTYALIRYIHKKNLVIDFAKAIWYLPLNEKFVGDAINSILRMFECVARDLIAVNSVRNANATAATASATAAAAIAAATATAAQAAAAAVAVSYPNTESISTPPTITMRGSSQDSSAITVVSDEALITTTPSIPQLEESLNIAMNSNIDAEMSELNVSHVLAQIEQVDGIQEDNQTSSNSSHESDGTDIDESDSEGSDGEGGDINDEEDVNSDDEDDDVQGGNSDNVIDGIRRRHRNLQRELALDPQVRTSTPISEDELEQQEDIEMRNERVIIGDEETDETQRDEDEEEMNDDDEEIMDEAEEDDVIEFEDALTDYFDVTYVTERNNELRALAQEFNRTHGQGMHLPTTFGNHLAFGDATQNDMGGRARLFNDFEILAASAGYVASIFTRFSGHGNNAGSITVGIPLDDGMERLRDSQLDSVDNSVQHPLLRRPSQLSRTESGTGNLLPGSSSNTVGTHPIVSTLPLSTDATMGVNHQAIFNDLNDVALQRMMFSRLSTGRRLQHASGLRRQGALRRWHPIGGSSSIPNRAEHRFLTRFIDESLFPEMNIYRSHTDGLREVASERRIIESMIPYFLDRLLDQTKLLDSCSMHFVSFIIAAYLAKVLLVNEEPRKEEDANVLTSDRNLLEEPSLSNAVSNESRIEEAVSATENSTATNPEACQLEGSALANETSALQISGNEAGRESPRHSNIDEDEQQSAAESVDSSELSNRLAVLVPTSAESEENTRDSVARSPMDVDNLENENAPTPIAEPVQSTSAPIEGDDTEPAAEPSSTDDFREILGGIEIPEGVDPAFLAALPEDIRQEVIRDHLRQQRAQRINQAQIRQTGPIATGENAEDTSNEPNVEASADEVLDQEFLAALPPELQEEVLAQHEQRIAQRHRQTAAGTNNDGNVTADNQVAAAAVDIDAVFESLPPGLRAQVLADADDSVLQILPPNLLAEANRLRANMEQQQVFRFARMMDRPRTTGSSRPSQQHLPSGVSGLNIEEKGVQIFDKESIVTLLLLYFMDQDKFCLVRLQKLLKPLCLHSGTCDYVIWNLLSILSVLNNTVEDESNFSSSGWIDSFRTQTALNQAEKSLQLTKDGVKVHQLVRIGVCMRVLDTLVFLARNFPQHFLPNKIRTVSSSTKRWDSVPDLSAFWDTVRNINKKTDFEEFKPFTKALTQLRDIIPPSLEQSPIAFILNYSTTEIVKNRNLMDKLMKILQIIAQSVPSDSQSKISDEPTKWLTSRLQSLANVILHACFDEGLKDGRMFFIEILRILPAQKANIFSMLYETVKEQGKLLEIDINNLLTELEEFKKSGKIDLEKMKKKVESEGERQPVSAMESLSGATHRDSNPPALVAENDLHLNTLKTFTKRNSQPKKFLKSLETISYLRNQLKQTEKRKHQSNIETRVEQREPEAPPDETTSDLNLPSTSNASISTVDDMSEEKNLEDMLEHLDPLWKSLSNCLEEMSKMLDSHAVLSLQHAAEAFFLSHAFMFTQKELDAVPSGSNVQTVVDESQPSTSSATASSNSQIAITQHQTRVDMNKYTQSMFSFAEKHRTVLNQILRGNTNNLMEDSAFAILTYFPKLLDFDVKRKYFYKEIRKLDDRMRHEDVAVRIRRNHLFSDSFRELFRLKNSDWKSRFYIIFEGEEGQDAGGLLREWYSIITREVFNPNYALFITAPGDRVTYMINKSSYINPEHLDYFKFVGRVIAKAIFDNKQLDCYFTRAFYKHILNVPIRYQDIESEDPSYFSSLEFLLKNPIEDLGTELTFSVEVEEFGVRSMRQLKEDGQKIPVTDANKEEYVQLVCQMKMTGSIRKQLDAFLEGFYQIIPKKLISIFNEQELELLISGLPEIDIDDLCNNTEYKSYNRSSPQVQWFWRALRSFEQEDLAKFLQFVTGTSKVPLQGFAHLEGMNGVQKFTIHMDSRSNDRLPSAHTCFNQLDLPKYESYEQLRQMLLLAIRECSEGFAFA